MSDSSDFMSNEIGFLTSSDDISTESVDESSGDLLTSPSESESQDEISDDDSSTFAEVTTSDSELGNKDDNVSDSAPEGTGFRLSKWENPEREDSSHSSGILGRLFSGHCSCSEDDEDAYYSLDSLESPFIDDVLGVVFSFLANRDLYRMSWVSRQFRRVAERDMLWENRVGRFKVPRFLHDSKQIKRGIVRSGKKARLSSREIYFNLSFPFQRSNDFIKELQEVKQCDFASDAFQCVIPFICYLLTVVCVFLLILKIEKIGSSTWNTNIGSILSFSMCMVFYFMEIFSIVRMVIYYMIGVKSGSFRDEQKSVLRNNVDRKNNSVLLAIDYFTIYGYFTISLNGFWGSYKLWSSLPCLMFLIFVNTYLEGYILYIFGLWVATFVFGNGLRYLFISKIWKVCLYQKDLCRKKRKNEIDPKTSTMDIWRNYYFLNDFFATQVHILLLYLHFFVYIQNERGNLGEDYGFIFVLLIPFINFFAILGLYVIRLVVSVILDAYNAVYIFEDDNKVVDSENNPLARFVTIFLFTNCFQLRGIKRLLDTVCECLPLLFSPSMFLIMYLLNFRMWLLVAIVPCIMMVSWGCPWMYTQVLYIGSKLGTLIELEKGLYRVAD